MRHRGAGSTSRTLYRNRADLIAKSRFATLNQCPLSPQNQALELTNASAPLPAAWSVEDQSACYVVRDAAVTNSMQKESKPHRSQPHPYGGRQADEYHQQGAQVGH